MSSWRRTFALSFLLLMGAWIAGFAFGWPRTTLSTLAPPEVAPPPNFRLFRDVWEIVNREFYGERPSTRAITQGAIRGLVAALDDPFATYLPGDGGDENMDQPGPAHADSLGLWFEATPQGAMVLTAEPRSPAAAAGLRPADIVLAAGDEPLGGRDRQAVLSLLQGPVGSTVVLAVRRGSAPPTALELTRGQPLHPPAVTSRLEGDAAYVRLGPFVAELLPALDRALAELLVASPPAMVIDLRDNPGGELAVLQAVASRLISGPIYRTQARDGSQTDQLASADGPHYPLSPRLAVLVNRGTVGEAEMLAAALRDRHGARLVGETTFGKGRLQNVFILSDSSALRLTVAEWVTPRGQVVEGRGLTPDRRLATSAADLAAGHDRQLEAALDLLGVGPRAQARETGHG